MRKLRFVARTGSVLLTIALPATANATAQRREPNPASQGITTGVTTVRELPELRSENSDTFLQSDGSRLLRISDHPVNFKRDGGWFPIEDRLVQGSGGAWEPAATPVPVSLPVGLAGQAVRVGVAGRQLSLALQGAQGASGVANGNQRSYTGALKDVNVSYAAVAQGLKETMTLTSAAAPSEYAYSLGLPEGTHASLNDGGSVTVTDSQRHVIYTIAAPTIRDSSNAAIPAAAPVRYTLNATGTILTLKVDTGWLANPARVYPVRIDPDVYFGAIKDCTIANSGAYENEELCGGSLFLGHSTSENATGRLLLGYDLSSLPKGSSILSSSIAMWLRSTSTSNPMEVEAYGLSREFTSNVTWNKYDGTHAWTTPGGDHLKPLAGSTVMRSEYAGGWVSIGFSPQVEQWVRDPSSNHGILLKAHNETENNVYEFVQTGAETGEGEPDINIVYEPQLGNPPNEAMFQEAIGNGGTLGVNVANGNLHITNPDVNYATEGYDTQLARSYNSADDELVTGEIGNGWRLSLGEDELLYPAWWDGSNVFHEPDGSYTRFDRAAWADNHPSAGDEAYTGDAYRPETLIRHENGTRTLTNNETGVEWQFDNSENGFPQKIVEPAGEGNTVALSYTSSRLTNVTDTHGHELTLTRETSGTHKVSKIKAGSGSEWKYTYNGEGLLIKYKGPEGQEAEYTYNAHQALESITDLSGTTVIDYDESGRVTSLRHIVNGTIKEAGSEDEATSFAYGEEETTVTHPDASADTYNYDAFGNIVEEPTTQKAASEFYASYAEIESEAANKAVDLQDHASILDSQLNQQLGGAYVGEWFNSATGKIVIGMTASGFEQTVETDLDNLGLADNAEIVTETTSTEALEAREAQLTADLKALIEAGKASIGSELSKDEVTLEVANSLTAEEKAQVATAIEKSGAPVQLIEAAASSVAIEETNCSKGNCPVPLRGGVAIAAPETFPLVQCTAGFITRSRTNRKPYLLTAGHCIRHAGGNGVRWAAEFTGDVIAFNETIGNSYSYVDGSAFHGVPGGTTSNGDAGLIEIAPGSVFSKQIAPYIITYGNTAFGAVRNERYLITKPHYSPQGYERKEQFVVCLSGTRKQEQYARCGLTRGYRYETPAEGTVVHNLEQFWQCRGSEVTSGAPKGTSGSPVYKNHEALGIYVAMSTRENGCVGYYEGINTAERVLNVAVVTG